MADVKLSTETTFHVSPDVQVGPLRSTVDADAAIASMYQRRLEQAWRPTRRVIQCDGSNALLSAVKTAYYEHLPLTLSPDAIWATLLKGFARHVNLHPEECREELVWHHGKETICVGRTDFYPGRRNAWPEAFATFNEAMSEHLLAGVGALRPHFTTTRSDDRAAADVIVMDALQAYFEYEMVCGCGIPSVTLTGTERDWQTLFTHADELTLIGPPEWRPAVMPVLDQFVRASAGSPEPDFWQSVFRHRGGGSGPSYVTGWITTLFPYHGSDKFGGWTVNPQLQTWRERLDEFDAEAADWDWNPAGASLELFEPPIGSAPVKVKWSLPGGEVDSEMRFVGGLMAVVQDDATKGVSPESGWAVLYETEDDAERVRSASRRRWVFGR